MMDGQMLCNIVIAVVLPSIGWAARVLYEDLKDLREQHNRHRVEVAEKYVRHEQHTEIKTAIDDMRETLQQILIALGRKADR